jgi:hypothetical protein
MLFQRKLTPQQWSEIQDRLEKLERAMKTLNLEWEDAYDRLKHMMSRVAKRAARMEEAEQGTVVEHGVRVPNPLNPRLAAIQQKILERRAGLKTNGGE